MFVRRSRAHPQALLGRLCPRFRALFVLQRGLGAHSVAWVAAVGFCGNFWAGQQFCDCRHLGIELSHLGVSSCPASVAGWGA